jgi:hypothetical protein
MDKILQQASQKTVKIERKSTKTTTGNTMAMDKGQSKNLNQ